MNQTLEVLTEDKIKEVLERDYGWKFSGPSYESVPNPKEEYVGENNPYVERIERYLTDMYIIKDSFDKDHSARRKFEREFNQRYKTSGFLSRKNKLGGNNNLALISSVWEISLRVKKLNRKKYDEIKAVFPLEEIFSEELQLQIENYNEMEFEEKVKFTRKMDETAYRFLKILSR